MYSDKDLLDFLDRVNEAGDLPDTLSRILDDLQNGPPFVGVRAAIAFRAELEGHAAEPIGTVPLPAADFGYLAADHGRLQWAFMLIDEGKAKDLAEAVLMMRAAEEMTAPLAASAGRTIASSKR